MLVSEYATGLSVMCMRLEKFDLFLFCLFNEKRLGEEEYCVPENIEY